MNKNERERTYSRTYIVCKYMNEYENLSMIHIHTHIFYICWPVRKEFACRVYALFDDDGKSYIIFSNLRFLLMYFIHA